MLVWGIDVLPYHTGKCAASKECWWSAEEMMFGMGFGPVCTFPLSSLWTSRRGIRIKFLIETCFQFSVLTRDKILLQTYHLCWSLLFTFYFSCWTLISKYYDPIEKAGAYLAQIRLYLSTFTRQVFSPNVSLTSPLTKRRKNKVSSLWSGVRLA